MKSPSTATQTGLYVLGGLAVVYLLGAALIYVDFLNGFRVHHALPEPVAESVEAIYNPFFSPLAKRFPELFPLRS